MLCYLMERECEIADAGQTFEDWKQGFKPVWRKECVECMKKGGFC
jgi:hypothetical protein